VCGRKNLLEKILDIVLVLGQIFFANFSQFGQFDYKKVTSINPKLICGRSLAMRQASNNGNKVHEARSSTQKKYTCSQGCRTRN
jgi:hypothetical protein